jgi:hypothetical protein
MENNVTSNTAPILYTEEDKPVDNTPLYTAEDTYASKLSNIENYSILKGVSVLATGDSNIPDKVNYDQLVDESWRKTVAENNQIDRITAVNAATNGQVSVFQEAMDTLKARNTLYGAQSANNAEIVRAKMRELTETAVENTAIKNPAVLFNNTTEEIRVITDNITTQVAAQASLEKALKDGNSIWNIAKGIGYEFTPFAAEQGAAIDRVAIKYGVPADAISRATGRSKTITYLQAVFQSLPNDQKSAWLTGLHRDLQDGMFISNWQAAGVVQEVASGEEKTWDGWSDWLDRAGVVGTFAGLFGAVAKSTKLFKSADKIMNVERTLASAGAKGNIVTAEATKILSSAANKQRLQAVGVVAGELTGINTAIDLTKLVSMNAIKVLPDAITTSAHDLQKVIREPVQKLIDELQNTIAAKGIRSEEAAVQLADLKAIYSTANNPRVHSVDPFTLSDDGTLITGRVFLKPENATAYLTKEAAETALKTFDPDGKLGMKIVPDTTNTGFLVEQSVKVDLAARKQALEAELLKAAEDANTALKEASKGPTTPVTSKTERDVPPKSLVTSKPRYKTDELVFEDDIDKAAYQIGSKTATSKSDKEIKAWLVKATGWSDQDISVHAEKVRSYIKTNGDLARDENDAILVSRQVPEGKSSVWENGVVVEAQLTDTENMTVVGNIRVQNGVGNTGMILSYNVLNDIMEFTTRMQKALGMEDRSIVVLNMDSMRTSNNALHKQLYDVMKKKHATAAATHFDYGNTSVIVMQRAKSHTNFMETYAHEFGHAFEAKFATKHFQTINNAFNAWLDAKGVKWKGHGINKKMDELPLVAMLEYRSITNADDVAKWVDSYLGGNKQAYDAMEGYMHQWLTSYSEFFAEQFTKWAFTDKVPTTILGEYFTKLVDAFKQIATTLQELLAAKGIDGVNILNADKNIARMLNTHVKQAQQAIPDTKASMDMLATETKSMGRSLESIQKDLQAVNDEMNAITAAETGLKTGWLLEQPVNRKLDYSIIGKYSDDDINSVSRYALGDWALSTSKELYEQRVTGINQQSRYVKLLTNFVRPSVEKLSRSEMVMLNDALVLGDKEGKVFNDVELSGMGATSNARIAYYKVRALRDIMHQMRNDVAAKSLTRKGYVKLSSAMKLDDGGFDMFVKEVSPTIGKTVYVGDEGVATRVSEKFLEEAKLKGLRFFESTDPILIDGKHRQTFAFKDGNFNINKIEEAIPYRAGEYRRLYSDEYFVKIVSDYDIDGTAKTITHTHRTASTAGDANAYIKAFNEAASLFKKGNLTIQDAARLMQPYGWKPEELLEMFNSGRLGNNYKVELRYNRTDDDYITEAIGLSSNFTSKRGDKVLSVHGEQAVNTVSPLDSIAAEIGNTAYVASITEWRESHIQRWFNTFVDDLPVNVRELSPEDAFRHMLNNKGAYIGQSKRLVFAERVQEYIMAQMNIPTKEEKQFVGFMRVVSESIEGATGNNKAMAKVGMGLRATKNYPQWARTVAFHSFFAFNPVQFFMQGMNAFNAIAISPLHGLASAKSASMYSMALMSDQESIWRAFAKTNKLSSLGLAMDEDEFVEVIRSIRRTGLLDGINSTSLYGAETGKFGLFNGLTRKVGNLSATPFNAGEAISRIISYDIARREFKAANAGVAWWTDDALVDIMKRQDDLTQNMTKANVASWQQGWKSIPAQFVQYQVKLMMNVVQSLLGNSRVFTRKEALQLLVMHTAVMGTAGAFLWPMRDMITDMLPEDMTETQRLTVQQGVVSGMIAAITDGEAKLALGSRFNTFRYYEDLVKGLFDPQKNFLDVLAGPSGFAALRIFGGFGDAIGIMVKAPMTMSTLQIALTEIGKSSFSAINNVTKARIAMANHNQVMSGSGRAMYRVTDTEAWLIGFGIPPAAQEDLSIMFASKKAHADELKAAAKDVGRHAMLAITALRNGDTESHKVHAAVVQTYLNAYGGDDLRFLMREAYRVEAFTQYEKMVVEQMVKQFQITDLTTQGQ